jgi:hypothetical protein
MLNGFGTVAVAVVAAVPSVAVPVVVAAVWAAAPASSWSIRAARKLAGDPPDAVPDPVAEVATPEPAAGVLPAAIFAE